MLIVVGKTHKLNVLKIVVKSVTNNESQGYQCRWEATLDISPLLQLVKGKMQMSEQTNKADQRRHSGSIRDLREEYEVIATRSTNSILIVSKI